MQSKYKVTINNNGLTDKDKESVMFAIKSRNANEALERAEILLEKYENKTLRLSYYAKMFLEALAISAEFDIATKKGK